MFWVLWFLFPFFLSFVLFFDLEAYSSVSSFCLILCVYFYGLKETTTSPSLEGEDLCRNAPCVDRMCLETCSGCGLRCPRTPCVTAASMTGIVCAVGTLAGHLELKQVWLVDPRVPPHPCWTLPVGQLELWQVLHIGGALVGQLDTKWVWTTASCRAVHLGFPCGTSVS